MIAMKNRTYLKMGDREESVTLAKAGVHLRPLKAWIPAFAGMTIESEAMGKRNFEIGSSYFKKSSLIREQFLRRHSRADGNPLWLRMDARLTDLGHDERRTFSCYFVPWLMSIPAKAGINSSTSSEMTKILCGSGNSIDAYRNMDHSVRQGYL